MGRARILAIDDQRYFQELIQGLLEDAGFDVQTAGSGEEALQVLEQQDFDVVVTDLVMPGVDGPELVHRIKERYPAQELVVVTGVVDVRTAVEAMKEGATDYILKPFDRDALCDSIDRILERRKLSSEHARLMEENLEFMSVLSLFERAAALFPQPLGRTARRTHPRGLVSRVGGRIRDPLGDERRRPRNRERGPFDLAAVQGLVRAEEEPRSIRWETFVDERCPNLRTPRLGRRRR